MKAVAITLLFALLAGCGAGLEEPDPRPQLLLCSERAPQNCPPLKPPVS